MGQENPLGLRKENLYLSSLNMVTFGRYSNHTVGTFHPGLNIVYGANEAGKSTTASFVRQVLFGWNRVIAGHNSYEPVSGQRSSTGDARRSVKRAGGLVFTDGVGIWELFRKAGETTVTTHEGLFWDDAFEDLLSDMDKETFNTVFAFDARELEGLSVDKGAVSHLLTAGAGTAQAPVGVLEQIQNLFKSTTSKSAKVGDSLPNLKESKKQLDEQRALLEQRSAQRKEEDFEYRQLTERQEVLGRAIEAARAKEQELNADVEEKERVSKRFDVLRNEQIGLNEQMADLDERLEGELKISPEDRAIFQEQTTIQELDVRAGELSAYEEFDRKSHEELLVARGVLAARRQMACRIDSTVQPTIDERISRRVELSADLRAARASLNDIEAQVSGNEAALNHEREQAITAGVPTRNGGFLAGVILAILGALMVVMGVVLDSAPVWIIGIPMVLTGLIVALLLTIGSSRNSERMVSSDLEQKRVYDISSLKAARHRLEQAEKDLASFDEQSRGLLDGLGFASCEGSLEAARSELAYAIETDRLETELKVRKRAYAETSQRYAERVDAIQNVLNEAFSIATASASEAIITIRQLSERLPVVRDIHAERDRVLQKRISLDELKKKQAAEAAELQADLQVLFERYHVQDTEAFNRVTEQLLCAERIRRDEGQRDLAALNKREGELKEILRLGKDDNELERVKQEIVQVEERLRQAEERHIELVVARLLMSKAIASWERDTQPEVYKTASELFELMTNGQWREIRLLPDAQLIVIDVQRRQMDPAHLSTGTLQQLYLSLRIALLITADSAGKGLPVVADDILVNFDDERRKGAAKALACLAQKRQVILFTCHKDVIDILSAADAQVHVVDL